MNLSSFFKKQVMVARVYGIPVRIDYRWFAVFAISAVMIALNFSNHPMRLGTLQLPQTSNLTAWTLGVTITVGLFLSVFGHELSHALMGRMEGIEIEEIVLHPFGGLARLRTEPESPGAEFRIAVAGPAASFIFSLIGFACMILMTKIQLNPATAFFFFICAGNLLLAIFNLFPGYPLDGGRVLRAIVWKRTGNIRGATRIAGFCGQLMAVVLILFGIYMAAAPSFHAYFMGLWSILIGLFLLSAATTVVRSVSEAEPATVAEAMSPPISIEPDISVSRFVDEILPLHRQTSFPVARDRRLLGILALEDLKKLPRELWRQRHASEVMRPVSQQLFVSESAAIATANELMQRNGVGAIGVIDRQGHLVGFLQRGTLKRKK